MKVFEYVVTYKNKDGDVIARYTYAANEDEACANYYLSTYSVGAELISIERSGKKDVD